MKQSKGKVAIPVSLFNGEKGSNGVSMQSLLLCFILKSISIDFKCPALSYVHVKQTKHPQLTVVVKYFTILTLALEKYISVL